MSREVVIDMSTKTVIAVGSINYQNGRGRIGVDVKVSPGRCPVTGARYGFYRKACRSGVCWLKG